MGETCAASLTSREIANITWAFGTVHCQMPAWLMHEIPGRAESFEPLHFANVFWALAITSQPMDDLVIALRKQQDLRGADFLSRWSTQYIATTAYALACCVQVRCDEHPSRLCFNLRTKAIA